MKKYQFDLSHPYFLHRSKDDSYFLFFLAILFFIGGLLSIEGSLFYIILSVSLSFIGINKLKRKDKIMQIDKQGITTSTEGTILWRQVKRCFCQSMSCSGSWNPVCYLRIILKNNETISIKLNDYAYNGKELSAAIDLYAGRKLFGKTDEDIKSELKTLLITLAFVLVFLSLIILLIVLYQQNVSK